MTDENLNHRTTSSVRVRIAQLEDAERITSVINSAFRRAEEFFIDGDRIDVESVLNFLNTGNFLLAEKEDVLVGCVYVEQRGNRAYLGLLAVDPAVQNFGLGSLLMDAAEDYCRGLSCRFMDIFVVNLREDLPGFYHRRGYVETGTSPFPSDLKTKLPVHFVEMSKPLRAEKE
jgi:GNAT superfamily N-acetyltransferase